MAVGSFISTCKRDVRRRRGPPNVRTLLMPDGTLGMPHGRNLADESMTQSTAVKSDKSGGRADLDKTHRMLLSAINTSTLVFEDKVKVSNMMAPNSVLQASLSPAG
jgi:hypothetical protein